MTYALDISEELDKKFGKLAKKNKKQLLIINKKVQQILEIDEKNNIVKLLDYEHHDKIY